jgi:2-polyprenyl-3-methyl-5-hydroxy-6-metoxy-1,4-benzoquinol methylase
MFDQFQYRILNRIAPAEVHREDPYEQQSKLRQLLGDEFLDEIRGKTVIDFGCGDGLETVEMAKAGADAIGLDIRESVLARGRALAAQEGVRCEFTTQAARLADVIVSLDAFEHFADPEHILRLMFDLLKPGGVLVGSFGPTWYHPLGGHFVTSVFPWAHLVFSESAVMRWRSDFRNDGAKHYHEIEGGLNKMTIRRFTRIARASRFEIVRIEPVPIRALRFLHCGITREFTSAVVKIRLRKPTL